MKYWSIRKVGIKELRALKWHRRFNTGGAWTKAGASSAGQLARMDEQVQGLLAGKATGLITILSYLILSYRPFSCSTKFGS